MNIVKDPHSGDSAALPQIGRPIVLVGLMGSGKSSVGHRLAARLGVPFADADTEIEAAAGQTISEIFAQHGESYFRDGERRVIARLLTGQPMVLATGGGAFMDPQTRAEIKRRSLSVWLKADIPVLVERVKRRGNRPLLQNGDPEKILSDLAALRYPVYAEADITVETGAGPHETVVEKIVEELKARQEQHDE